LVYETKLRWGVRLKKRLYRLGFADFLKIAFFNKPLISVKEKIKNPMIRFCVFAKNAKQNLYICKKYKNL